MDLFTVIGAGVGAYFGGPAGAAIGGSLGGAIDNGLLGDNQVDYNDIFDQQTALYKAEMNRRNQKFQANEVINSNLATNTLLVGGSKPIGGNNASGNNFDVLQKEFANLVAGTNTFEAYSNNNLNGLNQDQYNMQTQVNQEMKQNFESGKKNVWSAIRNLK